LYYPRFVETALAEALSDTPVVLIHGPRQCGKTTLAQTFGKTRGYDYFSFDDDVAAAAAKADPSGFVGDLPARAILDEVQREGLGSGLAMQHAHAQLPSQAHQ